MSESSSFPPNARLRVSAQFQAVFAEGRRLSGQFFRLHAHVLLGPAEARLGVTVSKRVDKTSVGRNRIKRQTRECFRLLKSQLPPGDYVVLAKPQAAKAESAVLRRELLSLFERARTLKPMAPPVTMPPSEAILDRPPPSES